MGKKAALTTEQQQQYDAVMQQLQASGALKGSGTEPATKRARTSPEASETVAKTSKTKEPSVAEKAAKTKAALEVVRKQPRRRRQHLQLLKPPGQRHQSRKQKARARPRPNHRRRRRPSLSKARLMPILVMMRLGLSFSMMR